MAQNNDLMLAWLNDAHAMENALIPILENHAGDAENHPDVRARIERHVEETRRHAELVKGCIERLGEEPSAAKTTLGGMVGAMQSVATGPFQDELVKNALSDYAVEHFEIAAYRALIAGARATGDEETARTCEQILRDEEDMARFLGDSLPATVQSTLRKAG
jgi:ferritin-like metal-binding protein YciE